MTPDALRTMLHQRLVEVTFKKINGDTREMLCTTNPDLIPQEALPKGTMEITEQSKLSNIRVYYVSAKGWRSFIFDNIISVK